MITAHLKKSKASVTSQTPVVSTITKSFVGTKNAQNAGHLKLWGVGNFPKKYAKLKNPRLPTPAEDVLRPQKHIEHTFSRDIWK